MDHTAPPTNHATRIVALGSIAEHGLLRFFYDSGIRDISRRSNPGTRWSPNERQADKWVLRYAKPGQTLSQWLTDEACWVISGDLGGADRTWHLLPAFHPRRNAHDPTYNRTRKMLRRMAESHPRR